MKEIIIKVDDVSHYYQSKDGESICSLKHVNLDICKGEFLAVVGSSGCGKSTLLNLLSNIIQPTQGRITINGENIDYNKHKIGYMSQSDTLLPWKNIIDNVAIGLELNGISKKERYNIARDLIAKAGLSGFEKKYPYELSGGMKKRVIILRTLATNPEIIFMDEPFGPLDVFTKELLQNEIIKIWEAYNNTIVYITHDINEAILLGDRIVLMSYRPSSVKKIYDVGFNRPRDLNSLKFTESYINLENSIRKDIEEEVRKSREE